MRMFNQFLDLPGNVWKWIKYSLIIMQSMIQNKSVVNFFGTRYLIAGNVVRKLG